VGALLVGFGPERPGEQRPGRAPVQAEEGEQALRADRQVLDGPVALELPAAEQGQPPPRTVADAGMRAAHGTYNSPGCPRLRCRHGAASRNSPE
jgi:hypothetical protein